MSMALNQRKIFTNSAGSLIWAHNLRGATEGGRETKQSTPTEALIPLEQPTTSQTNKTPNQGHTFYETFDRFGHGLSHKITGCIDPSTFNTNSFLQYQLQLRIGFRVGGEGVGGIRSKP